MDKTINIEDLNEKQFEIFNDIITTPASETKYFIIRASRQSGKTFLIERAAYYFSFEKNNINGAFISASYKQFVKVFKEMAELCPGLIKHIDKSDNTIEFLNGSIIHFYTARNYESIKGNTFDWIIADEVALYRKGALDYITPTLAARKNAKAIFASTPLGKNDFYDYCMWGMDSNNKFYKHYRMMYTDNEFYDLREVEEKRKTMPESIFRSEYMGEFVFGSSSVFGEFSKHQVISSWKEPISNMKYWAGIDWSGSGEDSTILTIINQLGEVVYIYECKNTNIPDQVNELAGILKKYNEPITYSECNGLGLGGTEMLQLQVNNVIKFWMSNESKNDLVTHLKINLDKNAIKLPVIDLFPKLDSEMCTFVVTRTNTGKLTYHHERNFHDDAVDSLLMANYAKYKMSFVGNIIYDTDEIIETIELEKEKPKNYIPSMLELEAKHGSWVDGLKY